MKKKKDESRSIISHSKKHRTKGNKAVWRRGSQLGAESNMCVCACLCVCVCVSTWDEDNRQLCPANGSLKITNQILWVFHRT